MKVYQVGGAVRDKLLGRTPKDNDFMIIGASSETLISMGYIPVGRSYDVFLHPETKDEYTLSEDLTFDLSRRDLTINAMALEGDKLIDPFGGLNDLNSRKLRSVKDDNFFHDPVRVYRLARFYSELRDFEVSTETIELVQLVAMKTSLQDIHPERILKELIKVLKCSTPSRFFVFLEEQKLLNFHFREFSSLDEKQFIHTMSLLDAMAQASDPALSYAVLFIHTPPLSAGNISDRLMVSNQWRTGAEAVEKFYKLFIQNQTHADIVEAFYQLDAYRRPNTLQMLLSILSADNHHQKSLFIRHCFEITSKISAADLPANISGKELGSQIKQRRIEKLSF